MFSLFTPTDAFTTIPATTTLATTKLATTIPATTNQAFADCNDLTLDKCNGDPPFQTLSLPNEKICQKFCNEIFHDCMFFIYDKQQDICQLYDYDSHEYVDSCALIAATPTTSLIKCSSSADECLVRLLRKRDFVKFDKSSMFLFKTI